MKFDRLLREGRDTDAVRLFARQYYDGGKMGHTRMLLLVRIADELDERRELQEAQSKAIVREQKRAESAEQKIKKLAERVMDVQCPPNANSACGVHHPDCLSCWLAWAMKEGK